MKRLHVLSPDKKYAVWKGAKRTTKVLLLLKDDLNKFLSPQQRTDLLTEVGKQYQAALKKAKITNHEKFTIAEANEKGMSFDEILTGIKQKWITVG